VSYQCIDKITGCRFQVKIGYIVKRTASVTILKLRKKESKTERVVNFQQKQIHHVEEKAVRDTWI